LGEEKLKKFLKFCLRYIADLDIPIQRGNFIEYRTGLINVSPIGRNCSQKEREEFALYNKENKVLENFKETVEKEFGDYNLRFSIGGQISFDCFPVGWDKTYCLQFLEDYDNIFFFGDKTHKVI
jgi:phosphomannomutase